MPKFRSKTRKGESDASESVSRDPRTAAVEHADLADDGLEAAPGTTTEPGAREVGVEYSGAPGAEELSELIAQTGSDAEGDTELGAFDPSTRKDRSYDEFTDDGDDSGDGIVSFEDRLNQGRPDSIPEAGSSGTFQDGGDGSGGTYGGVGRGASAWQNPIVNPITGEGATNPTASFTDYVETKTGLDGGVGGDAGGGPAPGSGRSVGLEIVTARDGNKTGKVIVDDDGKVLSRRIENPDTGITLFEFQGTTVVTDTNNGTITTLKPDGSTTTTTLAGVPVDSTAPLKQPGGVDGEEEVTLEQKLNDPLFQQYQQSKNAGGGGDGTTDPSETDDVTLKGGGGSLTQEEVHDQAVGRFGQPAGEDFGGEHRAGTPQLSPINEIQPGPDQDLVTVEGHTDDPANAIPDTEPIAGMPEDDTTDDTAEETSDDGGSFLPPGDFTPVDAPPDLPDIEVDTPG